MNYLSFSFSFLDKGLSFFFDMPKHVAYLLWVCIFYFLFSFFDMPKHVAYLLWVCIFYFLIAPYPCHSFEREVSYMDMEFYFVDGWNFCFLLV